MELVRTLKLAVVIAATILSGCKGQSNNKTEPILVRDTVIPPLVTDTVTPRNGIVFFSYDDGLTWRNKSTGLPSVTNIGLGGIAVAQNRLALLSKDSGLYFFNAKEDRWMHLPTDRQLMESNPGALYFYKDGIYTGTQSGGVFYSKNQGQTWTKLNDGLTNLTIRRFAEIDRHLYAATNAGLYVLNDTLRKWRLEYGAPALQVNGITAFNGDIYIATNQGAFIAPIGKKDWEQIYSKGALHNISSDDQAVYAMVYNTLFTSADKGNTWKNIQTGLPAQLYTFNVMKIGNTLLAGQWDGIYRKDNATENWKFSGQGLPANLAIVNMQNYNGVIIVSGGQRKIRGGTTLDK